MRQAVNKTFLVVILILMVFSVLPKEVSAQDFVPRISVAPHTFELGVIPGQIFEDKVKIINQSEIPIPITVKIVNFTAKEETGEIIFDSDANDPSFTPSLWFEIENPDFILDPGEVEKVNFKIKIPDNVEPGGHYAVMIFEPKFPSFYFKEEALVKNIPEIGVLFLFSVQKFTLEPDAGQKLEVVEFSLPKEKRIPNLETFVSRALGGVAFAADLNIVENPYLNFILKIRNNDIYHLRPSGKVLIYDSRGKKVGESDISQKTILPGKVRVFPVSFTPETPEKLRWLPDFISEFLVKNSFFGRYQTRIEVTAKRSLTAEIITLNVAGLSFFSLPWRFWIGTILFFGISITFIIKYRHRIKKAIKILFFRQQLEKGSK